MTQTARRLAVLQDTYQADWDTEGFTPAGIDTYGRFMRIRVFDCWFHEQDIRDAVGQPGGEEGVSARAALDEMEAAIGYVVGKKAAAPAGSRVTFVLTGPAARTIHVEVGERAKVVDELDGPATVTLTMPLGCLQPPGRRAGGSRIVPRPGRRRRRRGPRRTHHRQPRLHDLKRPAKALERPPSKRRNRSRGAGVCG